MEGSFKDSGEIKLKTRIDLDKKEFFDDKDNKYRVNKLIKLIDILKKDDFDIELDEMKFTKLKKYKDYPLVKLTKAELKKILANYDIREETYLSFLGIKILENETFSLQLDIFLDKFIRINLKEISFEENLEIIYRIFDKDNNGSITKCETQKLITYFHQINSLVFDEDTIKRIAEAVFKHIDKSNIGYITKSAMTKYLEKYKDEDITINPFTRVKTFDAVTKLKKSNSLKFSEEEEKLISRISRKKDRSKLKKFWFLNKKMIIWSIIYFVVNILSAYINMKLENNRIVKTTLAARFFAGIIFLNMSLVILFMCNYLNTLLSFTKLKFYLPLGDTKQYHIVCASVLGLATIPHVLLHLLGDFPYIAAKCATNPAKKYVTVFWLTFMNLTGITGVIILILFSIIIIVPLIKPIMNKKYELFLNTHKLFYIAIIIMFAHCRTPSTNRWPFVFFMTGPLIFFAIELIVRLIRYIKNESKIIRVKYLKSGVIMLEIQKPKKFNFRCGQYAQLNIPAISKWQWHPFTFASSPNDDNLFFFISPAGDWTSQLKNFSTEDINSNNSLNEVKEKLSPKEESLIASINTLVRVDGPHGAPAEHYNNYEHVMFVAGGVGATPFSSILIGLLYKLKKGERIAHKSITFFWIQREYEKFDYLNNILEELAVEDKDKLFEIDIFVTCAQQKYDFRSLFIADGIDLIKKNSKGQNFSEICSGNVFWGRPDWDEIFKKKTLKFRQKEEVTNVGVFVCGNDAIVHDIYEVCENYNCAAVKYDLNTEHF